MRAWLYATARNAAIDMLRRRKNLSFGDMPEDSPVPMDMDAADRYALREALEQLNGLQRSLVRMRYWEGYNAAEIASALNMTAANVRYHLMTAMRRLRREMKEDSQ